MRSACYTPASSLRLIPPWEEQLVFQAALIQQHFVGTDESRCLAALIQEHDFGRRPSVTPSAPSPAPLREALIGSVCLGLHGHHLTAPISGPSRAFVALRFLLGMMWGEASQLSPGSQWVSSLTDPSDRPLPTDYI